jgi:predicted extracellular nuclease
LTFAAAVAVATQAPAGRRVVVAVAAGRNQGQVIAMPPRRRTSSAANAVRSDQRDDAAGGLRLVTAHLKSKLLTYPHERRFPKDEDERARGAGYALLRRAAEAVAVRVHLDSVMAAATAGGEPGGPTVLCGDLNDGPDAVTTTLLSGPDDASVAHPDKGDPVRLYNLASLLPAGRAYSRIYQGRGELIDHILVSRDLRLHVHTIDSLVDDIGSITASVETRRPATVPDHAPVIARFISA